MTLADIDAGDVTENQLVINEQGEEESQEVVIGNTFIDAAIETSKATLRLSLDVTKTILKWD